MVSAQLVVLEGAVCIFLSPILFDARVYDLPRYTRYQTPDDHRPRHVGQLGVLHLERLSCRHRFLDGCQNVKRLARYQTCRSPVLLRSQERRNQIICKGRGLRALFLSAMNKHALLILSFLLGALCTAQAETLKMKDGTLISGSILSQTEYTLNLATSYGNITLNQRDIEQILPDKHRLILKGGTQLVGVILDMDEFNLKLQTDDGSTVNVDMPQIVSIEAYDYDRGQKAQQEFVEKKIEQQEQAQAAQTAAQSAVAAGTVTAAGGLTFDSDIDQVFDAKKATVVNGQVQTPSAQTQTAAPRLLSDEEAFLKNVKAGNISAEEYASAAKQDLSAKKAQPKKTAAPAKRIEKNFSKYFSVQVGAMPLDLKAKGQLAVNSQTVELDDAGLDMGGTSIAVSSKFLWRLKESNLWLGPTVFFANVPNNEFTFSSSGTNYEMRSSGSILSLGAAANYYLNPKSRFATYLTAALQYEMLSVNYNGNYSTSEGPVDFSDSLSSNSPSGSVGIGVETWIDDLMVGAEIRQVFAPRKDELKKSAASNTVIQVQLSWKF